MFVFVYILLVCLEGQSSGFLSFFPSFLPFFLLLPLLLLICLEVLFVVDCASSFTWHPIKSLRHDREILRKEKARHLRYTLWIHSGTIQTLQVFQESVMVTSAITILVRISSLSKQSPTSLSLSLSRRCCCLSRQNRMFVSRFPDINPKFGFGANQRTRQNRRTVFRHRQSSYTNAPTHYSDARIIYIWIKSVQLQRWLVNRLLPFVSLHVSVCVCVCVSGLHSCAILLDCSCPFTCRDCFAGDDRKQHRESKSRLEK